MPVLAINGGSALRDRPFHRWPVGDPTDVAAVGKTILSGDWFASKGMNVAEFEEAFAAHQGAKHGVAVNGGTTALQVALRAAGILPGDEVIVPSYTFVATALGVLNIGAVPVFCDVEQETFNIDVASAEDAITEHTTAIMPVHWGGRAADMEGVLNLADNRRLKVVEDSCHGWGASWRNRGLGSIGFSGGFSFQASKNLTAGEGGFVTTSDDEAAEIAHHLMWAGSGSREAKTAVLGSNYRISQISAALLLNQLKRLDEQNRVRMSNAIYLSDALDEMDGFRSVPRHEDVTVDSVYQFLFRYNRTEFEDLPRETFVEAINAEGVPVGLGYARPLQEYPLFADIPESMPGGHPFTSGCYKGSVDYSNLETPVTDRLCKLEGLTLPSNVFLGPRSDVDDVIAAFDKVRKSARELTAVAAV
jgi:dTDP-4-amino-4,6-dideoxygalactose transaminase